MLRFILHRLWYGLLVIFGVITIIFVLFHILPGDPARMLMGQRSDVGSVEAVRKDLGLDQPLIIQYVGFLNDISPLSFHSGTDKNSIWHADREKYGKFMKLATIGSVVVIIKKPYLRKSYQTRRKVTEIIGEAFPKTLILAGTAILFAFIIGVAIGVLSALWKDSLFDRLATVIAVLGMSLPSFFAAILIAWVFAFLLADYTGLNMVGSLYTVSDFGDGTYLDLKNLILPAFTLGIRPLAIIIELTRSSLLDILGQDFIRTAKAKGLGPFRVVVTHGLRNALNPVVTAVTGWFASLMAGAVFIEYVFDWKGIGVVIVDSLEKYDFPVLMGVVLFVSVILVLINIFVDILYGYLDPRVRMR
jgi:peptide/nickel transport system permease protein